MPISNRRTVVAAATVVAACALTLTACGSSDGSSNAAATTAASQTTAPAATSTIPSSSSTADTAGTQGTPANASGSSGSSGSSGGSSGSANSSGGSSGSTAGSSSGGSTGTPQCATSDLTISFETGGDAAPDVTSDEQQTTGVDLHNRSSHACKVGGFPGVDLNGGSTNWSLVRKSQTYSAITLNPGDDTDFSIYFAPEQGGTWTPQTVTITPPNQTTSVTLKWPWGPVTLQNGATHPATYVGPIG